MNVIFTLNQSYKIKNYCVDNNKLCFQLPHSISKIFLGEMEKGTLHRL